MIEYSKEELDLLRQVRITTILGVRPSLRRVAIRCPQHKDRTPSLIIYPDNSFHCFSCGINGQNAIDLLIAMGGSFNEAIEEIKKYG